MGTYLFKKEKLTFVLSFLMLLTGLTYINRFPTGDDAWFAEQSYWLQKQGIIRSEFFRGILHWEDQLLVSHKLFLLVGAGLIKIFGFGLPTVQFVGFISFTIIIYELVYYVRKKSNLDWSYYATLLLILLFSNRLLIKLSFENRPELMLSALGFGSFLAINNSRNTVMNAALAGLLAGLAVLSHLNGVIYVLAGAITLFYLNRRRETFAFLVVSGFTCLTYFIDIIYAKNGFATWLYQFRNDPATQSAFGLYSKLIVMLTYLKLFFESLEGAALSIFFIGVVWHQRKLVKHLPKLLSIFSICLVTSFWLITKKNSGGYLPLFMPFMLAIIYELYRLKPFLNKLLYTLIAIYFIIGIYGTIEIIYKNYQLGNFPDNYKSLRSHIPKNSRGLVPLTFFFNEYEQYKHLLCHENFTYYSNTLHDLPIWANQRNVDFIVMDYKYRREPYYPEMGSDNLPFYKLTYFDGRFAIYMNRKFKT